jgi:hypothetical protein
VPRATCRRLECQNEPGANGLCRSCHAADQRRHRRRYWALTADQRRRANARSYANSYQRRGRLVPQPCEVCGATDVQKHHDDYDKPLDVRWFCAEHHRSHHRFGEWEGARHA